MRHDATMVRYFGGSLELVSLDGWGGCLILCAHEPVIEALLGTDVFLRLPKLVSRVRRR